MERYMERFREIRKQMIPKGIRSVYDAGQRANVTKYPPGIALCLERSRLMTEVYRMTEGEAEIIRKAKAFRYFLENMSIYIDPHQLIVGNETSAQHRLPLYLEISTQWIKDGLNDGFRDMLSGEEREELLSIIDYWEGRSIEDRWRALLPDDLRPFSDHRQVVGHVTVGMGKGRPFVNFERLLRTGLKGVVVDAEKELNRLRCTVPAGMDVEAYVQRREFYSAVLIACEGVMAWARRYASLAADLAGETPDEDRAQELRKIAEVCSWVPENPPRDFHEALQFFYFVHLAQRLESIAHGAGYRFDQLMNPYYLRDLETKAVTRERALELLGCLWLKIEDVGELSIPVSAGIQVGALAWQNFALGGLKEDGSDATNEMSYLMIDTTMACRTREPALVLRYHEGTPDALIEKALDLVATGHGQPAFFNDRVIVKYLEKIHEIPEEVANTYSIPACVRWGIPGKSIHPMVPNVGAVSLLKCLELALNRGVDKFTGIRVGVDTGDPKTFRSLEDVKQAYLKQVDFIAGAVCTMWNMAAYLYRTYGQRPFSSALVDGGLEKGKEASANMYREGVTVLAAGPTNVANSLAVLGKMVFEEKRCSMSTLMEALKNNWDGYEDLRQWAINRVPKYGNDDSYVDEIMRWVHVESNRQFQKYQGIAGGRYTLASSIAAGYYALSLGTGATPDGRRDGEPCADATVSPHAGTDRKGPTAVLKSVAHLDPLITGWDHLLNQRFFPAFLVGKHRAAFKGYLKTWAQLPIWHIQFNAVSTETLRDAQKNPDRYSDLVVRVAGYSAYFTQLPRELQDQVIARTEQSLGEIGPDGAGSTKTRSGKESQVALQ
ncbi:MAG: hypothetical protein JRH07_00075 [Deltaproteobacteria bacterium]|nr:hypothetical protein [Deltaproteobacteria bacterium]MBW2120230.1 hypothetical protein [Deltaproteobacteria bacterium]